MPIQILPPILANQIAAGEVVERPASVVKELVENSLDAGAKRIEIEIEKGGAKLIRIRDNGGGIPKDELVLALSRHATSKVASLDDLEAITSLGFRGEALASISSVARLTLTSRTLEQTEAWQACAEGREMQVEIRPAAHPVGTTVEVVDLFFNTPARRKFLRSEKTEFAHIDELIRRLALSRFDVQFSLRHNGKQVKLYRAAKEPAEQNRRVGVACGESFMGRALRIDTQHLGLSLNGWLASAPPAPGGGQIQYSYVNGRMMRDKLINHAIRQACTQVLASEVPPDYVLYLQLDPHQVDVNVHPAKHEVRFHDARLVHDFIVRVIQEALHQVRELPPAADAPFIGRQEAAPPAYPDTPLRPRGEHGYRDTRPPASPGSWRDKDANLALASEGYRALMTPPPPDPALTRRLAVAEPPPVSDEGWQGLRVVASRYLLVGHGDELGLVALVRLERVLLRHRWQQQWPQGLTSQPLLMPVLLPLEPALRSWMAAGEELLRRLGIELRTASGDNVMLYRVTTALRQTNLVETIPALLQLLATLDGRAEPEVMAGVCHWLAQRALDTREDYTLSHAAGLLAEAAQILPGLLTDPDVVKPLGLEQLIEEFERE